MHGLKTNGMKCARAAIAVFVMLFACLACFSACTDNTEPDQKKLARKVSIDGHDVSELTVAEARSAIEKDQKNKLKNLCFRVALGEHSVLIYGDRLPITFNTEQVLSDAMELTYWVFSFTPQRELNTSMTLDEKAAYGVVDKLVEPLNSNPVSATATYDPGVEGKFVYSEDIAGKRVEVEKVVELLKKAVEGGGETVIEADYIALEPTIDVDTLKEQHVLVSEFQTSFKKSPHNAAGRVHNIVKAAKMIDGYVVEPGEEFDMNAVLGPRGADGGWKKAPGIRYGKYEMEDGGGVCQVSSTLFNAVLMADLEISARTPHSWPLTYIPIGRDATISTGGPNFKFINNRETPVVISATASREKYTITVRIYGESLPDGMTIKLSSKRTGTIPNPGNKILLDKTLPPNTRVVDRESRAGKKSKTYKEYYDSEGKLIERVVVCEDTYRAIEGIVYVSSDIYYGYDTSKSSAVSGY